MLKQIAVVLIRNPYRFNEPFETIWRVEGQSAVITELLRLLYIWFILSAARAYATTKIDPSLTEFTIFSQLVCWRLPFSAPGTFNLSRLRVSSNTVWAHPTSIYHEPLFLAAYETTGLLLLYETRIANHRSGQNASSDYETPDALSNSMISTI